MTFNDRAFRVLWENKQRQACLELYLVTWHGVKFRHHSLNALTRPLLFKLERGWIALHWENLYQLGNFIGSICTHPTDKLKVWELNNVFYIVLKLVLSWLRKKSHLLHLYIFKHLFTAWKAGRDRSPDMQNVQFRFPCVTQKCHLIKFSYVIYPLDTTVQPLNSWGQKDEAPLKNAVIYLAG